MDHASRALTFAALRAANVRRPLDRDEAARLGYPAADIAREFDA